MANTDKLNRNETHLIRRYLVWCYKTTKEELDKVDRYFTQFKADTLMLDDLIKTDDFQAADANVDYKKEIKGFEDYLQQKLINAEKKKFADEEHVALTSSYQYLLRRFEAIEKTIVHFLGDKELEKICLLYEKEMLDRILKAREHV